MGLCSSTSSSLLRLVAPRLPPGRLGLDRRPCGIGASDAGGSGGGLAILAFFFYAPLSDLLIFGFFFTLRKFVLIFFYIGANTYLLIE